MAITEVTSLVVVSVLVVSRENNRFHDIFTMHFRNIRK